MSPDPPDQIRSVAVDQLEALGLSAYAAQTFVAIVSLGRGTAQEVSEVSEVPRTRVYDAVKELQKQGLVDVQQSTPKQFWAISTETTRRHFEREYAYRVDTLMDALESLETGEVSTEQRGVWTVTGRDTVAERIVEFVETAEEEVVLMTIEELLVEDVVDSLREASDRGVSIRFAGMSEAASVELTEEVPDAETFESLWDWSDTPAARLLMVDQRKTLVSVLVSGEGEHPPEPQDETAIWGSGSGNGLVVVLKAMFTWQLDGVDGDEL